LPETTDDWRKSASKIAANRDLLKAKINKGKDDAKVSVVPDIYVGKDKLLTRPQSTGQTEKTGKTARQAKSKKSAILPLEAKLFAHTDV
jgi:hypothetical protein